MSKSNNEERRDIVNKRLSEINDKIVNPNKKTIIETPSENIQDQIHKKPDSSNKLKKYLLRITIVLVVFFVLKSINFGDLISSSFNKSSTNDETKIEVKVDIPAKEKILKYSFSFNQDEHIIIFGKYQTEEETLKEKEIFSNKFVEFPVNHFYLPDNSNSTEKVYQLYLGPIKGKANAKQWSKLIEVENILLSY